MRLADLPPDVRAKVAAAETGVPAKRPRPSRRNAPGEGTYRCAACDSTFTTPTRAEAHVLRQHGGGRYSVDTEPL